MNVRRYFISRCCFVLFLLFFSLACTKLLLPRIWHLLLLIIFISRFVLLLKPLFLQCFDTVMSEQPVKIPFTKGSPANVQGGPKMRQI